MHQIALCTPLWNDLHLRICDVRMRSVNARMSVVGRLTCYGDWRTPKVSAHAGLYENTPLEESQWVCKNEKHRRSRSTAGGTVTVRVIDATLLITPMLARYHRPRAELWLVVRCHR